MAGLLPKDFGDGWMSSPARDLCKIAVAFGGFDPRELTLRIAKRTARSKARTVNTRTVEAVLQEMYDEQEAADDATA